MSEAQMVKPLRDRRWVARRLGLSEWQVYDYCRRGEIPFVRIGRLVRFDEEQIERWIARGGNPREAYIDRLTV